MHPLISSRLEQALANDLIAYKDMQEFRNYDQTIALAVERSLLCHSCYLSEKLAVCSMADEDLLCDIQMQWDQSLGFF